MTKTEIEDKHFHQFLVWCSKAPNGSNNDLIFWLDHNQLITENFWEYIVKYRSDDLKEQE